MMSRFRFVSLLVLLLPLLSIGCKSGPDARSDEDPTGRQVDLGVDEEIRPWVLDDRAGFVAKFDPAAWPDIRNYVGEIVPLPADVRAESPDAKPEDGRELLSIANSIFDNRLPVDQMAADRPYWVIIEPRVDHYTQTCQDTSIPCLLFGPEGPLPRHLRAFVPSDTPAELADTIEKSLGTDAITAEPMKRWVHIEFLVGGEPNEASRAAFAQRLEQTPEPAPSITDARATALSHDGIGSVWVDLRGLIDIGAMVGRQEADRAIDAAGIENRLAMAIRGVSYATSNLAMDIPGSAELDDVALAVGGNGDGLWLDAVMSRTKRGAEVARAAGSSLSVAEPSVGEADISLDWALDLDKMGEAAGKTPWSGESSDVFFRNLRRQGRWGFMAMLRAPAAYLDAAISSDTSGLPAIRAIRARLAKSGPDGVSRMTGGAVVVMAPGPDAMKWQTQARRAGAKVSWLSVDTRKRTVESDGDEAIEIRLAIQKPLDEVFPDDVESSRVGNLDVDLGAETLAQAVETPGLMLMLGRLGMMLSRLPVADVVGEGGIAIHSGERERTAGIRLSVGNIQESKPRSIDAGRKLTDPGPRCLAELGADVRKALSVQSDDPTLERPLRQNLDELRDDFVARADGCADKDGTSKASADHAVATYSTFQALLAYRLHDEKASDALLQKACDRGFQLACDPDFFGDWPWTKITRAEQSLDASYTTSHKPTTVGGWPANQSFSFSGAFGQPKIFPVMFQHIDEVERCYSKSEDAPSGDIALMVTIDPTGAVSSASVESSTLESPAFAECAAETIEEWQFPSADGDTKTQFMWQMSFP